MGEESQKGKPSQGSSGESAASSQSAKAGSEERSFLLGIARGFGAAIIFSIPMLLTMEMWWLGFYADRLRIAVFALGMLPVLLGLGFFSGLRPTSSFVEEALDAFTAYGIGLVAAATVLFTIGIITVDMSLREIIGKIALLGIVASFGSMLGRSQLGKPAGKEEQKQKKQESGYPGQLFLELGGALYLSLTVAPTVEMIKLPMKMTPWHALAIAVGSIALLHAFVYSLQFKGAAQTQGQPWWSLFIRYSIPGYVLSLGVAAYLLWTFGRFENAELHWIVMYSVVLGFPASVGAAAGRLLL